jgi:phage baseplate assembly protein W
MANGFSAVIPLQRDNEDGFYSLTKTLAQNIKQNFKNLVLTSPGERVMLTDFGVGIRNFLFENNSVVLQNDISIRISEQVETYMPFIRIDNIEFIEENDLMIGLRIFYSVPSQNFFDMFEIIKPIL